MHHILSLVLLHSLFIVKNDMSTNSTRSHERRRVSWRGKALYPMQRGCRSVATFSSRCKMEAGRQLFVLLSHQKTYLCNHFLVSLVILAFHHRSRFSGTMSETSAFNADIQQLMSLMINKHLLLQPGYPSSRADFNFFSCPRHCQVRVYHLSRKDRGPTKFLHREHRQIRPSRPSRLRTLALV